LRDSKILSARNTLAHFLLIKSVLVPTPNISNYSEKLALLQSLLPAWRKVSRAKEKTKKLVQIASTKLRTTVKMAMKTKIMTRSILWSLWGLLIHMRRSNLSNQ
jgi:hypothetical protein